MCREFNSLPRHKKHGEKWAKWHEKCRKKAKKEFPGLEKNRLFITGVMLYWGEGDSKVENGQVRLANTDPEMIKIFSLFLQQICLIPKERIRIGLVLYPDLSEKICKRFWSSAIKIPESQFYKVQVIKGKHPTKRLSNGICNIGICSRELKEKISVWNKLLAKEIINSNAGVI